jgi:hypothetical protein
LVLEAGLLGVWPPAPGAPVLPWLPEALPIEPEADGLGELIVPVVEPVPALFCSPPAGAGLVPELGGVIPPGGIMPPPIEPPGEGEVFWVPPDGGVIPPLLVPPVEPLCIVPVELPPIEPWCIVPIEPPIEPMCEPFIPAAVALQTYLPLPLPYIDEPLA